jgi:diadenosine tetraphosphate (Ap4A) HIT family hydrolase
MNELKPFSEDITTGNHIPSNDFADYESLDPNLWKKLSKEAKEILEVFRKTMLPALSPSRNVIDKLKKIMDKIPAGTTQKPLTKKQKEQSDAITDMIATQLAKLITTMKKSGRELEELRPKQRGYGENYHRDVGWY